MVHLRGIHYPRDAELGNAMRLALEEIERDIGERGVKIHKAGHRRTRRNTPLGSFPDLKTRTSELPNGLAPPWRPQRPQQSPLIPQP